MSSPYSNRVNRRRSGRDRRPRPALLRGVTAAAEPLEGRALMTATPSFVGSPIPFASSGESDAVVAMFASGGFAIGKLSPLNDEDGNYQLAAQRYTSAGVASGSPVVVDPNFDRLAGMAADGAGDLVVLDTYNSDVYLTATRAGQSSFSTQSYVAGGTPLSVTVNAAGKGVALYFDTGNRLKGTPFTLSTSGTGLSVGDDFDLSGTFAGISAGNLAAAVAPDGTIGVFGVGDSAALFHTYTSTGSSKSSTVSVTAKFGAVVPPALAVDAHGVFTGYWSSYDTTSLNHTQQYTSTAALVGATHNVPAYYGLFIAATREGVLTEAYYNGTLADFDAAANSGSSTITPTDNSHIFALATNGTGSAVILYQDVNGTAARRVSIPAPAESAFTTYSVGQTVEAENYNVGGEGTAYHDDNAAQQGNTYRLDSGVDVQSSSSASNGYYVGYADAGEYLDYTVTVATTGTYNMAFQIRGPVSGSTAATGGQFHANFNGTNKTGTLTVTSSSSSFGTVTASNLSLSAGTYTVRVQFDKNATNSGAAANLDSFKLTAVATTPTPTQLTGTTFGTSGSYANSGNTVAKATDGNLSTYFDGPTANGNTVGLDLGTTRVVSQIRFAPRGGYASRMVGGVFQASNSSTFASGVATVYTVGSAPAQGQLTTATVTNTTAYRYWRYVAPNGSYGDIAEFQLFGTGPTLAQLSGTPFGTSGSYANSGNTIAKATDGNLSTFFDGPSANGNVVGLDLGSAKVVSQIRFAPRSGYASRMVGGVFQASNSANFSSGVVSVYTVGTAPAQGQLTNVGTNQTTAYRYWRYVAPNGSYGDIAEFQLFG